MVLMRPSLFRKPSIQRGSRGAVVGIEVLDCAERFRQEPATIDAAFAESLLARFTAPALEHFRKAHPQPTLFSSPR